MREQWLDSNGMMTHQFLLSRDLSADEWHLDYTNLKPIVLSTQYC